MDEFSPWEQVTLNLLEDVKQLRAEMAALQERFVALDQSVTLMYLNRYEPPKEKKTNPLLPPCK